MARLLRKTFMMLTLVIAVGTLVLPGVQAHAADAVDTPGIDPAAGVDAATILQAVLDSFESLDFEEGAAVITANGGQEYRIDLDVGEALQGVGQSSGNSTMDLMKYSLVAAIGFRLLRVFRRGFGALARFTRA